MQQREAGNEPDMEMVKELGEVDRRNGEVKDATLPQQHRTARCADAVVVNSKNKIYDSNNTLLTRKE